MAVTAVDAGGAGYERRRWEFWRSPRDQPGWARPTLLGIAAVAALLYARNIASAGFEGFYSVAVKSMSVSWKAFVFGAFDPAATITLDKLAGSFAPQAISARIFGFHAWSLALPQVIEGVIAVLAMYRVVRRWAGPGAGLLGAGIFALTPVAVSMFGHSMEDGALTMCLVLAADSCQRAMIEGRLRSLIWAGVWVGLGFQAKMLQAWIVLPALAAGYLVTAPLPVRRRMRDLAIAGAVTLAVSLSWIALYSFTPAGNRPYIDGSTNNSAVAMVFGYNGVERFGVSFPGSVPSMFGGGHQGTGAGRGTTSEITDAGGTAPAVLQELRRAGFGPRGSDRWGKLADSEFGPQIGWLFPLALLAMVCGLAWSRQTINNGKRHRSGQLGARGEPGGPGQLGGRGGSVTLGSRGEPGGPGRLGGLGEPGTPGQLGGSVALGRRGEPAEPGHFGGRVWFGGFVLWGVWLVVFGVVFSAMRVVPHTAYVASLAPALAALSAAGIVMFWREYTAGSRRWWLLPVAVAAELGWSAYLWRSYRGFLPVAQWAIVVVGLGAIATLVLVKQPGRRGLVVSGALAGAVAMVAAPAAWSISALDARYDGNEMNAIAGPAPDTGPRHMAAGIENLLGLGERAGLARHGTSGNPTSGNPTSGNPTSGDSAGGNPISGTGTAGMGGWGGDSTSLTGAQRDIYAYVSAHAGNAPYLMATTYWSQAAPYILATGKEVLPVGGFSGSVPSPTLARVRDLVSTGQLRFFLLSPAGGEHGMFGLARAGQALTITNWVRSACEKVPGGVGAGALYRCGLVHQGRYDKRLLIVCCPFCCPLRGFTLATWTLPGGGVSSGTGCSLWAASR